MDPLERLKVQDASDMYRVNEVSVADFISEFNKAMDESLDNKEK